MNIPWWAWTILAIPVIITVGILSLYGFVMGHIHLLADIEYEEADEDE